jgi:hypothetical protein
MGVILFILLGGYPPFYDESEPRLFDKIRLVMLGLGRVACMHSPRLCRELRSARLGMRGWKEGLLSHAGSSLCRVESSPVSC